MRAPSYGRASWPSSDDNTGFYLVVIFGALAALAYALWTRYHGTISAGVVALRHAEIGVIRHFTDRYEVADRQMLAADPAGMTLHDLYRISDDVGRFFRIPAALLMLALAAVCLVRAAPSRFRRPFDLDGLIGEQARSFPAAAAFARRRLRLVPVSPAAPRPADYALTSDEWVASYATRPDGSFDEPGARAALIRQLGPAWCGLKDASPLVRCLLAAFALHLAGRRAAALDLLGQFSVALGDRDETAEGQSPRWSCPKRPASRRRRSCTSG